ncbi:MAG: helicase-exonuclease AddAB subunit AddB [Clostridia bacterium]|nr:helicase-exonuclease AddAB subunit AddB [Clostridia bacterium]
MRLNIVYGRSGTGKSKYIYESIKNKLGGNKIFLIVPEQCNLSAEKKLFEIIEKNSLIDAEVLTLSRMAYRVSNEIGGSFNHLSKSGKDMLIFDLLLKEKNNLNFLGKSEKNIDIVNRMFTEFKKHGISVSDLNTVNLDDEYTSLKLKDITLLYEKYEEKLANNFIDENDSLSILANNLSKTDMFKDSIIYIDEFLGFTPQEYRVFEELCKKCQEITVGVATDNLDINTSKEKDIFYFNKKYANKLIKIAKQNKYEINEIRLEETPRFKTEELKFLEENLYTGKGKYNNDIKNIKLFLANNPYTEIEYVAQNIHNLVKNCGYSYKDIGIIAEEIEKYSEDAKAVCNKYDIPLFIDEKKELNQNILIKFILAMLDIFSKNWSFDSIFNYLKIGLLQIENEDIYNLENYCRKWGIKGAKFCNKELEYEQINDAQEKLENLRKQIVNPLLKFKQEVSSNRTVTQITKEIYKFIIDNKINETLDRKLKEYNNIEVSNEYNTSYKLLVSILEDLCLVFKDEKITFEKYKDLLEIGLNSSELGKIPATQDQVVLGDTERTRSNKLKVVFVIGINDGNFPKANRVEGYLNDKDREALENAGIELAKNSIDSLYEEQFNIYRTLTTPEEMLFLSYSSSDKEGKSIRPSILIKKIKRAFPGLVEESDVVEKRYVKTNEKATFEEVLQIYKDYLDGKEIPEEWKNLLRYFYRKDRKRFKRAISGIYYSNVAQDISKENIEKLYGNVLRTSVSKLESYRKCPFSFHMTYGLKLKEKEELKIEAIDTGSFMHEVIDLFFKELDETGSSVKDIEENEILKIVNRIVEKLLGTSRYYIFSSSAKFRLLTRRLKKVVYQSICYIVYSLKYSDFKLLGHEIEFSNTGKFKTINLEIENGKKVEIIGKIDRLDTAKLGENQYVRIVDYKSSYKDLDLNQVQAGLQIQLITYLDAICEQTNLEASGVLYMGLIDNVVKNAKNMSEEEIENKIRNNFKMKGLILADISVVKLMDNKLQTGASDIIPVYISKDGNISEKKSSVISKENFDGLQKQVKETIKEISKEILKGKVDIKPYNYNKKTGCDYCKYKTICMFNTNIKGNEYNYI